MDRIGVVFRVSLMAVFILNPLASYTKTGNSEAFDISYKFESPKITLKEPVEVEFEAKNQTDSEAQFDVGFDRVSNFLVTFDGPYGITARLLQIGGSGFGRSGKITLQPHKIYKETLLLNRWIEFKAPGIYRIEIKLAEPAHNSHGEAIGGTEGFRGTVEVLPESPDRLKETCESLAQRVENASSVEGAENPALALSYIDDPIAVPYLERILHARGPGALNGGLAVQGLARIRNDEAIRVLVSALALTDLPATSIPAWTTLGEIERQTDDQVQRLIIRQAIDSYEFKDGQLRKKPQRQ